MRLNNDKIALQKSASIRTSDGSQTSRLFATMHTAQKMILFLATPIFRYLNIFIKFISLKKIIICYQMLQKGNFFLYRRSIVCFLYIYKNCFITFSLFPNDPKGNEHVFSLPFVLNSITVSKAHYFFCSPSSRGFFLFEVQFGSKQLMY